MPLENRGLLEVMVYMIGQLLDQIATGIRAHQGLVEMVKLSDIMIF
jgi:hypothetical protein